MSARPDVIDKVIAREGKHDVWSWHGSGDDLFEVVAPSCRPQYRVHRKGMFILRAIRAAARVPAEQGQNQWHAQADLRPPWDAMDRARDPAPARKALRNSDHAKTER